MPDKNWVQQLSGLLLLAVFAYMANSSRTGVSHAPSVMEPAQPQPQKKNKLPAEVQEFMELPPNIQRQVLDYARNWINAHFERVE